MKRTIFFSLLFFLNRQKPTRKYIKGIRIAISIAHNIHVCSLKMNRIGAVIQFMRILFIYFDICYAHVLRALFLLLLLFNRHLLSFVFFSAFYFCVCTSL